LKTSMLIGVRSCRRCSCSYPRSCALVVPRLPLPVAAGVAYAMGPAAGLHASAAAAPAIATAAASATATPSETVLSGAGVAVALRLLPLGTLLFGRVVVVVSLDDGGDQRVPHDVGRAQVRERDAVDAG